MAKTREVAGTARTATRMSKIKDFLGQEALDALELVDEGLMTVDEWYKRYLPNYSYDDHDCHAEGGESGCDHPAHGEDIV